MATTRKNPAVIVLTEEDLVSFVEQIQAGFADLAARLDAIEERIAHPGLATAKERKQLANLAVKAVTRR